MAHLPGLSAKEIGVIEIITHFKERKKRKSSGDRGSSILGQGLLTEYFLHRLPENQVILPEYFLPKINGHLKNSRGAAAPCLPPPTPPRTPHMGSRDGYMLQLVPPLDSGHFFRGSGASIHFLDWGGGGGGARVKKMSKILARSPHKVAI